MSKRIGIVGVGVIGSAVAARLIGVGWTVYLCTRDPSKLDALVKLGAILCESPAALMRGVEVAILSLNTAEIVDTVVFGPHGLAAGGSRGKLVIDMSSTDPRETSRMAKRLREEFGLAWVDAPLSGGATAALNGTLTLMLGGRDEDIARANMVLNDLATNITHMGCVGAGQTTKLINQVLCACSFLAVAEATRLALDADLDPSRVVRALAGGRADSRILQEFMPKMAARDLTPTGRIENMLKDLESVQRLANSTGTPLPVTAVVTEIHRIIVAAGFGGEDSASYMKLFDLDLSGAARRPYQATDSLG